MSTTKGRLLLISMIAMSGVDLDRLLPPARPVDLEPLTRPCTQCGASIGKPCNRFTLGRYPYHLCRMAPAGASGAGPGPGAG